jgi:hypothetical protein
MAHPNAHPVIAVQGGGATAAPTLLGQGPARIPTGGKIRAGIKVLTKKAAGEPKAKAIYDQGVAAGQSFEQIERAIAEALPDLKTPLVPRNVPWFTVRAQDFPNPEVAREILDAYGEDRGEGRRLYRFPVVFPSDYWQTVMPHEWWRPGVHGLTSTTGRNTRPMAGCATACAMPRCRSTPRAGARSASSAGARP